MLSPDFLLFLQDNLKQKFFKFEKMKTGSASINYKIQGKDAFLIKVVSKENYANNQFIVENLKSCGNFNLKPILLKEISYQNNNILIFKWIDGKSVFIDKLNDEKLKKLEQHYIFFIENIKKNKFILPARHLKDSYDNLLNSSIFGNRFVKKVLCQMQSSDLIHQYPLRIIHGDFHYKNLIFQNSDLKAILDLEEFRYGYPTEDLIRLIFTNVEQRPFYMKRKAVLLRLLRHIIENAQYSKHEWLLGLNAYFLAKYEKKMKKYERKKIFTFFSLWRSGVLFCNARRIIQDICT